MLAVKQTAIENYLSQQKAKNIDANKIEVDRITGKMSGQYDKMLNSKGFNKKTPKKKNNLS